MRVDHVGYAVRNIEKAAIQFETLGYSFEQVVNDYDRNIRIQFGNNEGYRIELIAPMNPDIESPVDVFLSKVGPTPYHICYKTEDIVQSIVELEEKKYKVIIPLANAVAFGGKRVVFMMHRTMGMIEIVEE